MKPEDLQLHPESGELVVAEVSYRQVSLEELQSLVASHQANVDQLTQTHADQSAAVEATASQLSEAQAALEDAKSVVSRGSELTGAETPVDDGTAGTSSEDEVPTEEVATF